MPQQQSKNDPPKRVADPEEYNQQARLRAINDARQRVEDTIEQSIVRQVTDPEFEEGDRRQVVRATMFTYLSNVYWLMVEAAREDEETAKLVKAREFGEVVIDPPSEFVDLASDRNRGYPRVIGDPDLSPATWPINGVKGYLEAPWQFEAEWSLQVQRRHERPKAVTRTEAVYMPVSISQTVFGSVNGFLNRAGVDVNIHQSEHRAVVDEELMKEVEEWRQQNIQ